MPWFITPLRHSPSCLIFRVESGRWQTYIAMSALVYKWEGERTFPDATCKLSDTVTYTEHSFFYETCCTLPQVETGTRHSTTDRPLLFQYPALCFHALPPLGTVHRKYRPHQNWHLWKVQPGCRWNPRNPICGRVGVRHLACSDRLFDFAAQA